MQPIGAKNGSKGCRAVGRILGAKAPGRPMTSGYYMDLRRIPPAARLGGNHFRSRAQSRGTALAAQKTGLVARQSRGEDCSEIDVIILKGSVCAAQFIGL